MQVSIPAIGIKTFFEYYSEIRMRTIDVALSADMNDRAFVAFSFYLTEEFYDRILVEFYDQTLFRSKSH